MSTPLRSVPTLVSVLERRIWRRVALIVSIAVCRAGVAQAPPEPQDTKSSSAPIAIVALNAKQSENGVKVTGALEVAGGKAILGASGEIASGSETTQVTLPRRGTLRVCASTSVKLSTDASVPAADVPGLMMAMDHGAIEASFATGRNADVLMTPDFRILIGGPGSVEVKVRLGENGDTCVDNPGADAPYVLVSSVFEGGAYRVQPGQRVMFQHGSLKEVVDDEKEPCGCPPPPSGVPNEFPLAQSEGLAPLVKLTPSPSPTVGLQTPTAPPLVYSGQPKATQAAAESQPADPAAATQTPSSHPASTPPAKKPGFFHRVGNFFRRIFGAE